MKERKDNERKEEEKKKEQARDPRLYAIRGRGEYSIECLLNFILVPIILV